MDCNLDVPDRQDRLPEGALDIACTVATDSDAVFRFAVKRHPVSEASTLDLSEEFEAVAHEANCVID